MNRRLLNKRRVIAVRLMNVLALLLIASFLTGFVLSSLILQFPNVQLADIDFPLSSPSALAVERNGNIVVASGFYGRIQVYSSEGRFLRGFFYPGEGGNVRIVCDRNGQYLVYVARENLEYVFSGNGHLLAKRQFGTPFSNLPNPYFCKSINSAVVNLRNVDLNPRVDVTYPDLTGRTLISNPLPIVPFVGPIAPWVCLVLLAVVRHLVSPNLLEEQQKEQQCPSGKPA